jgi:hypothetical protein
MVSSNLLNLTPELIPVVWNSLLFVTKLHTRELLDAYFVNANLSARWNYSALARFDSVVESFGSQPWLRHSSLDFGQIPLFTFGSHLSDSKGGIFVSTQ